ncbi:hypothetical protein FRB90_011975 [Tulasnella sp. 427]|nr:hypothetical protein FRB90_011975 [Tulasnella sp. 427]
MAQSPEERNQEVKRIVVTQRTDPDDQAAQEKDTLDEPLECPEMYGDLKKAYIKLDKETGFSMIELSFHLSPSASPAQTAPVEIRIGETTAQDLIAEIGSPPRVHYKEDDRMLIHKSPALNRMEDDDDEGSMPLPSLLDASTAELPGARGGKKGRKKGKGVSPEPLIDIGADTEALPEVEQVPGSVETVSLFTKVEDIKTAFGPSSAQNRTSGAMSIPVASSRSPSVPQTPRSAISRQLAQLAMSTSPPTMVLDRSSDTSNSETTSLVGGTTQLMGFDGMVLEVSELGDVLSVMIF